MNGANRVAADDRLKPAFTPVIYVAGPYRAGYEWAVRSNIERAAIVAAQLWQLGAAVICPHLNTQFMGGLIPNEEFLKRDLLILNRCDALFLMEGSDHSVGTAGELSFASERGLPVLTSMSKASDYIHNFRTAHNPPAEVRE